jgi:hypothetical protein
VCHKCGSNIEPRKAEAPAEEQKLAGEAAPRPLRRIVRRPVEKKAAKPEEAKPSEEQPKADEGNKPAE